MEEKVVVHDNTKDEVEQVTPVVPLEESKKAQERNEETHDKEVKMFEKLIQGHNDVFDRTYTFKEIGETFRIKVKYPTFLERGRINAKREEYLGGTSAHQPYALYMVYQAMATLQVCGIDLPPYFSETGTPREDILYKLAVDLDEWMGSFR